MTPVTGAWNATPTVDDVRRRVADIEAMRRDAEAAHSEEDRLAWDVLRTVAYGLNQDHAAAVALAALASNDIDFPRWCA